jgi:hypothetical protein
VDYGSPHASPARAPWLKPAVVEETRGPGPRPHTLSAVSDLRIALPENREIVASPRPSTPHDWPIVADDVTERFEDGGWARGLLGGRFVG